ncbi:MAG: class I SAM-dependent methyltransferase [Gammaproteobacteria bacterium]|nr:class I SAM-dependent methyltransferase [Gammaproteobacteria bacterium]
MSEKQDFWGEYWAAGPLTSMVDGFESNYQGELRDGWLQFFSTFSAHSRLLDIGTGNGAIAMIAAEYSRAEGLNFELHGADRALIDPQQSLKEKAELVDSITFHSQAAAENLPFADQYFAGVSGQYAFEYTEHEKALAELWRVLQPGGLACFVMHDHASEVLRRGREQLRQIGLIEGLKFYEIVDALGVQIDLINEGQAVAGNETAEKCRHQVNEVAATLSTEAASSFSPESLRFAMGFGGRAMEILGSQGIDAARDQTARGRKELAGARLRYEDLARAAGPVGQSESILAMARKQGFIDLLLEPVNHDGTVLIGQRLTMLRPE